MNKKKGNIWLKIAAMAMVCLSILGIVYGFSVMSVMIFAEEKINDEEQLRAEMLENALTNYAVKLLNDNGTEYEKGEDSQYGWDELEDGSLIYAVEKEVTTLEDGQLKTDKTLVYGDENFIRKKGYQSVFKTIPEGCEMYANTESAIGIAWESPSVWRSVSRYQLEDIRVEGQKAIVDVSHEGEISLLEEETEESPDEKQSLTRYLVYMGMKDTVESGKFLGGDDDYIAQIPSMANKICQSSEIYVTVLVVSCILFLVGVALLCAMAGYRPNKKEVVMRWADKVPYILYLSVVVTGISLGVCGVAGCVYCVFHNVFSIKDGLHLSVILIIGCTLLAIAQLMTTAVRIKEKKFWRYSLCYYVVKPFLFLYKKGKEKWQETDYLLTQMRKNNKKGTRMFVAVSLGLSLAELLFIGITAYAPWVEVILFLLFKAIEIPLLYRMAGQFERIRQGGRRVACGDYTQPIQTKKMIPELCELGENINHVSDGISLAVEEKMKSERMKTELITNVSHDIKTPLTSIINYVDLIKKENIEDRRVREYVDVLDRQSARLKKLIEDLIEVSKASTGNVDVHIEKCDAQVMLSQLTGEYQERMKQKGLELVVNETEIPAIILADGRHLWRVLDNVMSNIYKYAMDNTRVYIDMEVGLHQVRLIFKNISKFPLNITSEELMERFVRGDSARNTEGHGLGLSIAQSLTELMGGTMEIEIDGDLFKVVVIMKR